MTLLLDILDWTFVFVLGLPVLYLFVFAAASTRARKDTYPPARRQRRVGTLIPAHKSQFPASLRCNKTIRRNCTR